MSSPSTVDLLPDHIRSELQALIQDPRITIVDATERINAILEKEGHDDRLSKSSVGRAAQRWKKIGDRIRQTREVGEMFISKVGAAPQGQTGLAINEILRTMACELSEKLLDADLEDPETMSATIDQVKSLALAVQRLEQSASINVKRDGEIKKAAREKALQDAAETVSTTAKQAGVSPETIEIIRRDVLRMAS